MYTDPILKLSDFFSRYKSLHYTKKEFILIGKQESFSVHFVVKGAVKTVLLTKDGRELIVTLLGPGDIFPMRGTHYGDRPKYSFQAFSNIELKKAPKGEYLEWVQDNPDISDYETQALLQRLTRGISRFEATLLGNAYQKVASTLLFIADNLGIKQNGYTVIPIPLTHQEIADMTGLARETVTVEIDKLKKEGLVKIGKEFILIKNALKDTVSIF